MNQRVNCITINTDASFHPEHRVSGYAFWIACDRFKIQESGLFNIKPQTAEEAEIMCIGNAIDLMLGHKHLPKSDCLIINSDCKFGMKTIEKKNSDLGNRVFGLLNQLIKRLGNPNTKMRYVKAHSGKSDERIKANEWCDTEAKKWMRTQIPK